MDEAHFEWRACNSNNKDLKEKMIEDNRYVTHGCSLDKMLGYKYSPDSDTMRISELKIDCKANTKRLILAESSKLFDPLSFTAPILVRSKLLISTLWGKRRSEDHWDETVSGEDSKIWSALGRDLEGLSALEFPRLSLSDGLQTDFFLFCDASRKAYGVVVYAVQDGVSQFVFAKPKVAPLKSRTLPQLELLGAKLGLETLESLLEIFKHVNIGRVYLALDAQVVLSWILSPLKIKNIYTSNRNKDVKKN